MGDNVGDDDGTDKQDAPHLTTLHYRALPCLALLNVCVLAFLSWGLIDAW